MIKINLKYFLSGLIFSGLLLLANFHTIGLIQKNNIAFSNILVITILIVYILIVLTLNGIRRKKTNLVRGLLFLSLGVTITISSVINGDFSPHYIIIFVILMPIAVSVELTGKLFRLFLTTMIISLLPIIYWVGFGNTLGMLYALMGVLIFIYSLNFQKKSIWIFTGMIFSVILIYITESRTALLSYLLVVSGYYFLSFLFSLNGQSRKKVFFILVGILGLLVIFKERIEQFIFSKYTNSKLDVLSSRTEFWSGAFSDGFSMWGHGNEYFILYYGIGNSHNTFIEILALYGIMATLILGIILIKALSIRNAITLPFILLFLIMSMTENLLFIDTRLVVFVIAFVIFISYAISSEGNRIKGEMI